MLSLSRSRSRLRRPIFIISLLLSFAAGESRDSLPGVADAVSASLLAAAVTTSVVVVVVDRRTYRGVASFVPSAANERRTDGRKDGLHDTLSLPLPLPLPRRRGSGINFLCPRWCAAARRRRRPRPDLCIVWP